MKPTNLLNANNALLLVFREELFTAMHLIEACGNLEIQITRAASEGNPSICQNYIAEAMEILDELDALLLPIGFQAISESVRANVQDYVRIAELQLAQGTLH